MPFPKPCERCDKKFQPNSFHSNICEDCKLEIRKESIEKTKQTKLKLKEDILLAMAKQLGLKVSKNNK